MKFVAGVAGTAAGTAATVKTTQTAAKTIRDKNATTQEKAAAVFDAALSAAGAIGSAALAVKSFPAVKHEIGYYMAKYQCKTVDSKKLVDVFGKTVTMDNSTFDPNFVDKQGRTNVQRMEQGLAPIGRDGKSVNIHHIDQTNSGPVMEITATEHQQNYSNLHTNIGQEPSQIDRNAFSSWRKEYWQWRSKNLT